MSLICVSISGAQSRSVLVTYDEYVIELMRLSDDSRYRLHIVAKSRASEDYDS